MNLTGNGIYIIKFEDLNIVMVVLIKSLVVLVWKLKVLKVAIAINTIIFNGYIL